MRRAQLLLRREPPYRYESFASGVRHTGFTITPRIADPRPGDVLVIWNRYGTGHNEAMRFERAGGSVLVAENGPLGREWRGGTWYSIARNQHNGAGLWPVGGPERWDSWNVELAPWRATGSDIVILATRNIGNQGIAEPRIWSQEVATRLQARTARRVRIRKHPGENAPAVTLEDDLRHAWACVTWGSGAALKALLMGVPVFYGFERWIGSSASTPLVGSDLENPRRGDRLAMFQRAAWCAWSLQEIESGEPFRHLLGDPARVRGDDRQAA